MKTKGKIVVWPVIIALILFSCKSDIVQRPKDFNFTYSFNHDELNTFDSTYKRSGIKGSGNVILHDTIIKLSLTSTEKDSLYQVMVNNNVFSMPKFFDCDPKKVYSTPDRKDYLYVKVDDTTIRTSYYYGCTPKDTVMSVKYLRITKCIEHIIGTKKEIQSLPNSSIIEF